MTTLPFVFNHRTGELWRQGRVMTLCRLHAQIFGCLAAAQGPISQPGIARAIGQPVHSVEWELKRLARLIAPLGISIASKLGSGKWLEFEDIPKWQPKIAPPVLLPNERGS